MKYYDSGIWMFWQTNSKLEPRAMYECESCGAVIVCAQKDLPKECPVCLAKKEDK